MTETPGSYMDTTSQSQILAALHRQNELMQQLIDRLDKIEVMTATTQERLLDLEKAKPTPKLFYTPAEAAPMLGYKNRNCLYAAIRSGKVFRKGIEVIDARGTDGAQPSYRVNVRKAIEWLALPVVERDRLLAQHNRRRKAG